MFRFGRYIGLVKVDSAVFINSCSIICLVLAKSSCFVVDQDQRRRIVCIFSPKTLPKLLQCIHYIICILFLEIRMSRKSRWVFEKHGSGRLLDFRPEIGELRLIGRLAKESPKPSKFECFAHSIGDAQGRKKFAIINPDGECANGGEYKSRPLERGKTGIIF